MGFQLIDPPQVVQCLYDTFNVVPEFSNSCVAIITNPTTMFMSLVAVIPMQLLFDGTATFARCTERRSLLLLPQSLVRPHLL